MNVMHRSVCHFVPAALLCLTLPLVVAADQPPTAAELAERIDRQIRSFQQVVEVTPSRQASDEEYLRRVYLDLAGRIPTVAEARDFLRDKSPDKRAELAKQLVDSGAHARHMATFWRRTWIPQGDTQEFRNLPEEFETWLTLELSSGAKYDEIVRKMLTVEIQDSTQSRASENLADRPAPESFLTASLRQPANLAANTTRAFLGLNLDCAQCHDHPFSRWTQEQFWETAAFFVRPSAKEAVGVDQFQVAIPETTKVVSATLLVDGEISWPEKLSQDSGRDALANWVADSRNPYFAKNAVNRMWAHYFGVGLVEPLDDISEDNIALQPEILETLADAFVKSDFDLKLISEAIVRTEAYQRTSRASAGEEEQVDRLHYARMPVRGMSGEQLYDSLRTAAGMPAVRADLNAASRGGRDDRFSSSFFVEDPAQAERSILQTLTLMNGETTAEAIDPKQSPLIKVLVDAPFLNNDQKIDTLFLATLGRNPEAEELEMFVAHLQQADSTGEALSQMMWVLLNSAEFNTNH